MFRNGALVVALAALSVPAACSRKEAFGVADDKPAATASTTAKSVTPAMIERGREIYKANCVLCHGESGKGDGPGAAVLDPKPGDHSDYAYMSTLTDKEIADAIRLGGAFKGRPLMPSHPQIGGADMEALVGYIRTLSTANK
jgi:cytochrome c oxidase cbb3-type subunit 3